MKAIVFPVFMFFFIGVGHAQTADNGQHIIKKFFDLYTSTGPAAGLEYAFGTNKWINSKSDEIGNVHAELEKLLNLVGNFVGFEEINSRMVGQRFRVTTYFVYYERQPLRFTFQLYRNNDGWALYNFKYDSSFDDEIVESVKLSE